MSVSCTHGLMDNTGCIRIGTDRRALAIFNGHQYSYLPEALDRHPAELYEALSHGVRMLPRIASFKEEVIRARLAEFRCVGDYGSATEIPAQLFKIALRAPDPAPARAWESWNAWAGVNDDEPCRAEAMS